MGTEKLSEGTNLNPLTNHPKLAFFQRNFSSIKGNRVAKLINSARLLYKCIHYLETKICKWIIVKHKRFIKIHMAYSNRLFC